MFKWSAIGDQVSQDIDAQISILHHQGFKYIEIRKINTKFLYEPDYKFIMELGEKLKHVGMRCSCISTDIGKNKDVNYDVFFRSVDYAKFLKVHYIRV